MAEDSAEKQFAPTERRLQDARAKGQVPIGRDLLAAASFGGLALALFLLPERLLVLAQSGRVLLDQAPELAQSGSLAALGPLLSRVVASLLAVFLLPAIGVVAVLVAQQGLTIAGDRLRPKLSRISPLAGLKRRFGLSGLVDFAKSTLKLGMITTLLGIHLGTRLDKLLMASALAPQQAILLLGRLIAEFVLLLAVFQLAIGMLDLLWQRFDHLRQLRMSRKELSDDLKQTEGDPQMKAQRRHRAEEIATSKMLADVGRADVVIVNPTHYAVALKWSRASTGAPVCIAKGVDEIAARIRATAAEQGVPIRRDPPAARALHATVALGAEIRPEHYRAVAAAIRYAEALRRRAARRSR